jgi:hypothetical protein
MMAHDRSGTDGAGVPGPHRWLRREFRRAGGPDPSARGRPGRPGDASSCRNGSCRTCICRLLEGEVAYRIEWPGVLPEEKAQGFILPCVAHPQSDVVLQFQSLPWM